MVQYCYRYSAITEQRIFLRQWWLSRRGVSWSTAESVMLWNGRWARKWCSPPVQNISATTLEGWVKASNTHYYYRTDVPRPWTESPGKTGWIREESRLIYLLRINMSKTTLSLIKKFVLYLFLLGLFTIAATLARGKAFESWGWYRPYWINSMTLGETQSGVNKRLETKVQRLKLYKRLTRVGFYYYVKIGPYRTV